MDTNKFEYGVYTEVQSETQYILNKDEVRREFYGGDYYYFNATDSQFKRIKNYLEAELEDQIEDDNPVLVITRECSDFFSFDEKESYTKEKVLENIEGYKYTYSPYAEEVYENNKQGEEILNNESVLVYRYWNGNSYKNIDLEDECIDVKEIGTSNGYVDEYGDWIEPKTYNFKCFQDANDFYYLVENFFYTSELLSSQKSMFTTVKKLNEDYGFDLSEKLYLVGGAIEDYKIITANNEELESIKNPKILDEEEIKKIYKEIPHEYKHNMIIELKLEGENYIVEPENIGITLMTEIVEDYYKEDTLYSYELENNENDANKTLQEMKNVSAKVKEMIKNNKCEFSHKKDNGFCGFFEVYKEIE